jgi:transcription elongation factor S-II
MPAVSTVLLTVKGECRKANLTLSPNGQLEIETLQKYFKKKEEPEEVATYTIDDRQLSIFGYKKGKKGSENKTALPFPYSDTPLYGDALLIVHLGEWEQPIPYTMEQWMAFYQRIGGNEENDEEGDEKDGDEEDDEKEKEKEEEEEDIVEEDEEKDGDEDVVILEEDEEEEVVEPVRKPRRAATYQKLDPNALKQEIAFEQTPDAQPIRTLCLRSLTFLEESFTPDDILSLERSIFEVTFEHAQKNYIPLSWRSPLFGEAYRQTLRSVLSNIHPKSPVNNSRLLRRVIEGEFPLSRIPTLTSYEMYPENWFELKDKLVQREQKILEGNKSRATDQFKCRRCHKRECTYYELQTRSADEPMTIFITCLNCGKEWRQGG